MTGDPLIDDLQSLVGAPRGPIDPLDERSTILALQRLADARLRSRGRHSTGPPEKLIAVSMADPFRRRLTLRNGVSMVVDLLAPGEAVRVDGNPSTDLRLVPEVSHEIRRAVLAEARLELRPDGPWVVDSALALLALSSALDIAGSPDFAPLAGQRASDAARWLARMPAQALVREQVIRRSDLHRQLRPIFDVTAGTEAGSHLTSWWLEVDRAIPRRARDPAVMQRSREPATAAYRVRTVAMPSDFERLGIVERGAALEVWSDSADGALTAVIPLDGDVAEALQALHRGDVERAAWAKLELRALVRGGQVPSPWLHAFMPGSGEIIAAQQMVVDADGSRVVAEGLQGDIWRGAGLLAALDRRDGTLALHAMAAEALVALPFEGATAGQFLLTVAEKLDDNVLARAAHASLAMQDAAAARLELAAARSMLGGNAVQAAFAPEDFSTTGCLLVEAYEREQRILRHAILESIARGRQEGSTARRIRAFQAQIEDKLALLEQLRRMS